MASVYGPRRNAKGTLPVNYPEYILHAKRDESIGECSIKAGTSYFLSRTNAAELLAATDHADVHPATHFWIPRTVSMDSASWNGRSVLFCRSGGIGDILATTPAIHEIKTRWPACKIIYATHPRNAPILQNNPDVDDVLLWPVMTEDWNKAGNPIWLDGIMEDDANSRETHFVDLVGDQIGLPNISDKRMRYFVTDQERAAANSNHPKTRRKRLGIQVHSNAACRTYPWKQLREVVIHFMRDLWEIVLFGAPNVLKNTGEPGIIFANNLPIRDACALVETCDAFIAPDSAFCHIAGALNVPTVALYGPFPWKIRTKYAPSIHPIQGHARCAPCYHHVRRGKHFCDACPSAEKGFCEAMESIDPKTIIKATRKVSQT